MWQVISECGAILGSVRRIFSIRGMFSSIWYCTVRATLKRIFSESSRSNLYQVSCFKFLNCDSLLGDVCTVANPCLVRTDSPSSCAHKHLIEDQLRICHHTNNNLLWFLYISSIESKNQTVCFYIVCIVIILDILVVLKKSHIEVLKQRQLRDGKSSRTNHPTQPLPLPIEEWFFHHKMLMPLSNLQQNLWIITVT